jgi:hypothetical protein
MNDDPEAGASNLTLDLSPDERHTLIQLLRRTIDEDRYPLSPRLAVLRAILAKHRTVGASARATAAAEAVDAPHPRRRRR